jgi:hypothetical protein
MSNDNGGVSAMSAELGLQRMAELEAERNEMLSKAAANALRAKAWKERCGSAQAEAGSLRGLIAELLDTELAELACAGSHSPVEDILGRMQAAIKA